MNALEFIRKWNRMLKVEGKAPYIELCTTRTPEETVSMVEEWSAAHPLKTRQSIFLEQYPNAKCVDGIVAICPKMINASLSCPGRADIDCPDCRREFWLQEVE